MLNVNKMCLLELRMKNNILVTWENSPSVIEHVFGIIKSKFFCNQEFLQDCDECTHLYNTNEFDSVLIMTNIGPEGPSHSIEGLRAEAFTNISGRILSFRY